MKKISKYLLMCIIVLAFLASTGICAFADNLPSITVSSENCEAGEIVDITVSLADNPGVISMMLKLNYDSSVLTLKEVKDTGILGSTVHGDNITKVPYILCWANDTAKENYTVNGTIVTLVFEIAGNAPVGKYPVTLSYAPDNYEIVDKDLEPVKFEVNNGVITVEEKYIPAMYSITYDANGGTGAPTSQIKTEGVDIVLSSQKPERQGYVFKGWSDSADGAVKYMPGETFAENDNVTLYAVWEKPHTVTTGTYPNFSVKLVGVPKGSVIMFAGYNLDRLVHIEFRPVKELETEEFVLPQDVEVIKTFVFKGIDNMVPVTESESIRVGINMVRLMELVGFKIK